MPDFQFHIQDGARPIESIDITLDSPQSARKAAAHMIGQMMIDREKDFGADQDWCLTVADARGITLLTLTLLSVLSPVLD